MTDRFRAIDLVRLGVAALGGKEAVGGPMLAQGGGPDGSQADAAIQAARDALASA